MDAKQPLSASEVVNNYPEDELADIFARYGEERWSKKNCASDRQRATDSTHLHDASTRRYRAERYPQKDKSGTNPPRYEGFPGAPNPRQ